MRYCHSDKSRYDSPFLLTCRGGRNRAVSPATRGCSSVDRQNTAQVCSHSIPGGGQKMAGNRRFSCGRCRSLCCYLALTCWNANTHACLPGSPATLCIAAPSVAAELRIFNTSWLAWPHQGPCKGSCEQPPNASALKSPILNSL